jgi:predicted DNA-binding transcriptional regulator AlpA
MAGTNSLLDLHALAKKLSCSARHVEDLGREGKLPAPIRLGRLKRWDVATIDAWIAAGCPAPADWKRDAALVSA